MTYEGVVGVVPLGALRVEPDAFYTSFYRALLEVGGTIRGEELIQQALEESLASRFTIFDTLILIRTL